MRPPPESQNTTQNWMIGIAVVAILLAMILSRDLVLAFVWMSALGIGLILPSIALYGWIEFFLGTNCPWCRERLQIASVRSFGYRYYKCPGCQGRLRRGKIPLFSNWEDASDPAFEPIFARKKQENPWTAPPDFFEEEVGDFSKTHGSLVRNKRRRNPQSPNWPLPPET